jgi:arsenate reductase
LTRTGVSTEVVTALDEIAIDCRAQSSKSLADLRQEHIDDVFVLAPPALEAVRTMFPTATLWEWPMDDPLHTPGGRDRVRAAVCSARDELKRRLQDWLTHDAHKR